MPGLYRVAIVEDQPEDMRLLTGFLERYQEENLVRFEIRQVTNGLAFLEHYRADFDVIFLDVMMPQITGMELAHMLRKVDPDVCLIFTTELAKYAVEGYAVRAMDYILKPLDYVSFAYKLRRALQLQEAFFPRDTELRLTRSGGVQRLLYREIYYVEVLNHTLYFHTTLQEEPIEQRGSISTLEEELSPHGFARCSNSFLMNLRYVSAVQGNEVFLGGRSFTISRTKKKAFLQALTDYLGENHL